MRKTLPRSFFDRRTLSVARDLLGKYLVRRFRGKTIALMITEVEAYDGPHDLASHASRGRTQRNRHMFGKAGVFYVYFTYGMHWLLNIVTGPEEYPAAVLLRGGIGIPGTKRGRKTIINGPARLTKFLKVDGRLDGTRTGRKTGLWVEDRGITVRPREVRATKRIGVDYAGPVWKEKKYNVKMASDQIRII